MDDIYLRANIKGEYHEVRLGYFILSVPIEFADKLTLGEFSEVYNILIKASDEYNKNVISPDKNPGEDSKQKEEAPKEEAVEVFAAEEEPNE